MTSSGDVPTANFDLICTLPLSADLITLATHPTQPLFAAGFASGFVQTYRLPEEQAPTLSGNVNGDSEDSSPSKPRSQHVKFSSKLNYQPQRPAKTRSKPCRSSLASSISSPAANGHAMIETVWRTRRHKGSCRALTFSTDGKTLFSAGTDGIVKAADAETGVVVGKALVPGGRRPRHPSRLLALNPKCLILGDDEGGVHEYELQETPTKQRPSQMRHAPTKTLPQKTHYPHRTEQRPNATDPITSLTALPPSGASTSKISRSWISTAGSTLAICDTFKGVVTCSDEQGAGKEPLELLSSVCVQLPKQTQQTQGNGQGAGRKKGSRSQVEEEQVVVLVGDSAGGCSSWPRGEWESRAGHTNIRRNVKVPGLPYEDFGVECLAVGPPDDNEPGPLIVAGLAVGRVHFLKFDPNERARVLRSDYPHDDQGLDGCNAVAFDAHGRMITGGGAIVKIWRRKFESSEIDMPADMDVDEEAADTPESSDDMGETAQVNGIEDSEDLDESDGVAEDQNGADKGSNDELGEPPRRKRTPKVNSKKRKRGKPRDDGRGDHGILRVKGLK